MMTTIGAFVGWASLLFTALGIAFAGLSSLVSKLRESRHDYLAREIAAECRRRGVSMLELVNWFGLRDGHIEYAAAWHAIATELALGRWPDVQQVRDYTIPKSLEMLKGQRRGSAS